MTRGFHIPEALAVILMLGAAPAPGQTSARGAVTYVSGEVYYVSLGSAAGAVDSALALVLDGRDTVATLRVFAVSSKSSACRLVSAKRPPKQGDAVLLSPDPPRTGATAGAGPRPDSTGGIAAAGVSAKPAMPADTMVLSPRGEPASRVRKPGQPSDAPVVVRGRVSAQYQTYILDSSFATVTSPSLSVSLRGQATGIPVRFDVVGSLRSTVTGTSGPFASGAVGRNRIYRLSVEYDDSLNRFGVGRLFPSPGLPSAYIDGVVASRRFGIVQVGAAAGYEPDYRQERFLSDRRKVMAFASAGSADPFSWSASAGFAKTFLGSSNERSVLSGAATAAPSRTVYFTAQTEIDLLTVKNSVVTKRAKVTSLLGLVSVRAMDQLTVGAGLTAWRPVYPLSVAAAIPDSMRDGDLRMSPSISLRIHGVGGFNLQEQYTPRSAEDGFGKEFSNQFSVGMENIARSGVGMRATQTLNRSSFARTTGYGVSARRTFAGIADAGVRYQYYRHDFDRGVDDLRTKAAGADVGVALNGSLYLMLGAELSFGSVTDYRLFNGSLTWRF